MKNLKFIQWTLLTSVFILGSGVGLLAQDVLPEITVTAERYKYLNAVSPEEAAQPVSILEHYVATYDVKSAEFYEEAYDNYFVSFYIPNGKILAVYNRDGVLLRTAERYKNAKLQRHIVDAVAKRFPNWAITKDVYLVNYYQEEGDLVKKEYKLVLENGNKRMKVKINDLGEFL